MILLGSKVKSFFFNDTATTEIYTLSLHDALPIQGDVETVLGLQVEVKPMLDDVIGGQPAQTEQLSSILGSSVLAFNRSKAALSVQIGRAHV